MKAPEVTIDVDLSSWLPIASIVGLPEVAEAEKGSGAFGGHQLRVRVAARADHRESRAAGFSVQASKAYNPLSGRGFLLENCGIFLAVTRR